MSEESTTRVAKAQAYIQKLLGAVPNLSYHAKTMGSNGVTLSKIRDGKQDRISEKVFKQIVRCKIDSQIGSQSRPLCVW